MLAHLAPVNQIVVRQLPEVYCYDTGMDRYSLETWILDRHQAVVSHAEARSRLQGWQAQERLAVLLAAMLRQLADKLDGSRQQSPSSVRTSSG